MHELLDVPPVLLVSEHDALEVRKEMAAFMDGRHVNDALYRSIMSIRADFDLEPHSYMISLPGHAAEIPLDLQQVSDIDALVGVVCKPRSLHDQPFRVPDHNVELGEALRGLNREAAIQILKIASRGNKVISLPDTCDVSGRFLHTFSNGRYHHSYRTVVTVVPEAYQS